MKKVSNLVFIFIFSMVMAGCSNGGDEEDFQGVILEVKKSSITVGTDDVDPEASYPVYEVFVDDQTKIKGVIKEFSKLKVDQKVQIWVKGEWSNNPDNKMVANKIIVSKK
ncbi:hypothetical protein [Virgibacillus doumboii]|uniref:hypothetical protein n=1 Tax=Virgibacillus doumboii TaxID=2697503 RepID=UPI0013DFD46B|nr:hypothetical protein [Virgibacillus doumboii]